MMTRLMKITKLLMLKRNIGTSIETKKRTWPMTIDSMREASRRKGRVEAMTHRRIRIKIRRLMILKLEIDTKEELIEIEDIPIMVLMIEIMEDKDFNIVST